MQTLGHFFEPLYLTPFDDYLGLLFHPRSPDEDHHVEPFRTGGSEGRRATKGHMAAQGQAFGGRAWGNLCFPGEGGEESPCIGEGRSGQFISPIHIGQGLAERSRLFT